jgi:hypothetical protein
MRPFSHSVTAWPFSARNSAVQTPMMPPPTTTTPVRAGSSASPTNGSRSGGIVPSPAKKACVRPPG